MPDDTDAMRRRIRGLVDGMTETVRDLRARGISLAQIEDKEASRIIKRIIEKAYSG